jgi:heme/copper-type cytochrome/quinol oxidase subunit 3
VHATSADYGLESRALPVGNIHRQGLGWSGVLCLIATEGSLFGYLIFSYCYFAVQMPASWSPEPHPSMKLALPNTIILLASSVAVWWSERGVRVGARGQHRGGLALGILLGIIFLVIQGFEWHDKPFNLTSGAYGSLYFTITGFHMAHVAVGVLALATVLIWSEAGYFDQRRNAPVLISSLYWHFVDAVWLGLFTMFYLAPYLR